MPACQNTLIHAKLITLYFTLSQYLLETQVGPVKSIFWPYSITVVVSMLIDKLKQRSHQLRRFLNDKREKSFLSVNRSISLREYLSMKLMNMKMGWKVLLNLREKVLCNDMEKKIGAALVLTDNLINFIWECQITNCVVSH